MSGSSCASIAARVGGRDGVARHPQHRRARTWPPSPRRASRSPAARTRRRAPRGRACPRPPCGAGRSPGRARRGRRPPRRSRGSPRPARSRPTRRTCAPPASGALAGRRAASACAVAGGSAAPSENRTGAAERRRHELGGGDRHAPVRARPRASPRAGACRASARGRRPARPRRRWRSRRRRRCASCCSWRSPGSRACPRPRPAAGGTAVPGRPCVAVVRPRPRSLRRRRRPRRRAPRARGGSRGRGYRGGSGRPARSEVRTRGIHKTGYSARRSRTSGGSPGDGGTNQLGRTAVERRGAQALSAPARQLTPQADERELCRCPVGAWPHSYSCCCAPCSPRPVASAETPPPHDRRSRVRAGAAAPADGLSGPLERQGGRRHGGAAAARRHRRRAGRGARPGQAGDLGRQLAPGQAVQVRRRPRAHQGHGLRLLGHRLLRPPGRRPAQDAAGLRLVHVAGASPAGRLDHGLHEPRPRLRGHRRACGWTRARPASAASARSPAPRWRAARAGVRCCARRAASCAATRSPSEGSLKRGPTRLPGRIRLGLDTEAGGSRGRTERAHVHRHQGEDQQDAGQGGGPVRDAGVLLREADGAAAERQEGRRRRRHGQEAPPAPAAEARAAGGQARHPGAPGARRRPRGPRPHRARAQAVRPDRAADARRAGRRARDPAAAARSTRSRSCAASSSSSAPRRRSSRRSTRPPRRR